MSLLNELKRRNVFNVVAAYLVVGWLLTEVLTTILPTLGAPEWAAKAVILTFVFGFIPTVILSWVYEWTPQGIKREEEDPNSRGAFRKSDYATIAVITLAIVAAAFFGARDSPDETIPAKVAADKESIAVLPFVNMSKDENNEYFSDGLTETLLHMLAQIPNLKVAARTSSFAFKGKNMDIREIAEALQVAHVLEGSVQQVGSRVRITAQLIRAADGFHIWSESFDRTIDNIFSIQDEIATKVGGALSVSLLGTGGEPEIAGVETEISDAYDLYLQALKKRETFSHSGLQAAERLLKGALTIDPDFLDAKTELASNYLHQIETGLMDRREAHAAALAMANQVLAARPDDVGARAIRLFVRAVPHMHDESAEVVLEAVQNLETLIAEHPDQYQGLVLLTRLLKGLNQSGKALGLQLTALQRDPYNARIHYEVGTLYLNLGQLSQAKSALQQSLDIEPLQPNAYLQLAHIAQQAGDAVEYLRQQLKAWEVDPGDHEIPGFIAAFLYQVGLVDEGDDFRDRVNAIAPTSSAAYRIALLRAVSRGDEAAGLIAARGAIEDDIDDRQFSYGGAVQFLLRSAAKNGTVAEESGYLERHAPGILDLEAVSTPAKYRSAQYAAFDAWYTTLPQEELSARFKKMREISSAFGADPLDDPRVKISVSAMRGDIAQAKDVALSEVFSQPVTMNLGWRDHFAQAQFTRLVEDPEIQDAMQHWEEEEIILRQQLKAFLTDLS